MSIEYTDEQAKKDIFASMDSVSIVERIGAIDANKQSEEEKNELFRNERHLKLKMAIPKFVENLSAEEKKKINDLGIS